MSSYRGGGRGRRGGGYSESSNQRGHYHGGGGGAEHSWRGGGRGGGGRGGGGRGRPPAHLRGKDIGLWYARGNKQNAARNRAVLHLEPDQLDKVERLLSDMERSKREEPSQAGSNFLNDYQRHLEANRRSETTDVKSSSDDNPYDPFRSEDDGPQIKQEPVDHKDQVKVEPDNKESVSQRDTPKHLDDSKSDKSENPLFKVRQRLPAFKMREDLISVIESNQVTVISGETGCGKTTQVPQFVLEAAVAKRARDARIVCTQPRRISAITVAQRVAEERGERLGQSVGYQIRLESVLPQSPGSTVTYCTTGVVLQWMRGDPLLERVTHIVLDEIHERDIQSDFLISLLKHRVLPSRPDLKVVLMSATLNADKFSRYFHGCPSLNIPGFTYPVEELYLEDVLQWTGFSFPPPRQQERTREEPVWLKHRNKNREKTKEQEFQESMGPFLRDIQDRYSDRVIQSLENPACEGDVNLDLVASLVNKIHSEKGEGAILVFLTGWSEISKLNGILTDSKSRFRLRPSEVRIFPLHSLLPTADQRAIFQRPGRGVRKIVIATNIAETSITIDDVVYVVDAGKIKMSNYDVDNNIATLQPEWVSLANARQRRGRAGRVQAGVCYHLFTRNREMILDQFMTPEILRVRLDEVILSIKILELGRVQPFLEKLMDNPSQRAIQTGLATLEAISALDPNEGLFLYPDPNHLLT